MITEQALSTDDWTSELMSRQTSMVDGWSGVMRELSDRMYEHADDTTVRSDIMNISDELASLAVRTDKLSERQ